MFFTPHSRDKSILPHDPLKAIVAPRPIGWISSLSKEGIANLAPYSFFNAVGGMPPMLMFASEGVKDSARNAVETGEFVFNYASEHLEKEMNASSLPAPSGVSEFDHLGISAAESQTVAAPRVADACAALECKVTSVVETVDIDGNKTGAIMIIGQVTGVHIDEQYIRDGRFDVALAKPVTRLGYLDFGYSNGFHEMPRPGWDGTVHNP
ncbi:MAG: flavin reductase family protein [Rhizobiaceae bacterium]|nr:flavin reductase family protein [Rhizobiaceae bacterium]